MTAHIFDCEATDVLGPPDRQFCAAAYTVSTERMSQHGAGIWSKLSMSTEMVSAQMTSIWLGIAA